MGRVQPTLADVDAQQPGLRHGVAAIAYAAARIGDRDSVDEYLLSSERRWAASGRPPPWTVDDAGFRALAADTMAGSVGDP